MPRPNRDREVRKAAKPARRTYKLTAASAEEPLPTYWLWEGRIPIGELTITAGHGEVGKSTFNIWLIAMITLGKLPGRFFGKPQNCFIAATEDSWRRTVIPRLIAAGADLDRVFRLDVEMETATADDYGGMTLSLPTDYALLEAAIREKNAKVVFFDSLMSTIDTKLDTHKGRDARVAIQPLAAIADRTGCAIIGNAHFNKASSSDPVHRLLGSAEFRNVPRAQIAFAKDGDGTHVLSCGKNNLGMEWPSLEYRIESAPFSYHGRKFNVGVFVLGDEASVTALDILAAEGKERGGTSKKTEAAVWLSGYMARHGGKVRATDALNDGEEAGHRPNTLRKAMAVANVEPHRIGFGKDSYVVWETVVLPPKLTVAKDETEEE